MAKRSSLARNALVQGAFKISPYATMKEVGERVSSGSIAEDWIKVGRDIGKAMKSEQASRAKKSD